MSSAKRLAIVFCVHHKPWLVMSTLLTTLMQDRADADFYFVYNLGDGTVHRPSYVEYDRLAANGSLNPQLSSFDPRVRDVCQIKRDRVFELEYENDHGLDSGVWYKFIRDGRWRDYEQVLFLGEGALLAHPRHLTALMEFTARRRVHFVASGHEKRRVPKTVVLGHGGAPGTMDDFCTRMKTDVFSIFCRDPEFKAIYDRWSSNFPPQTENHVPGVSLDGVAVRRLRARVLSTWGTPFTEARPAWPGALVRSMPFALDRWVSQASLWAGSCSTGYDRQVKAYYNGVAKPAVYQSEADSESGVSFHRVIEPEWFGCTVLHLMSREFLSQLSEKLDRFGLYDAIDLPFAGASLEPIWGMLPAWLGFEKWFTNGFHRVRKDFTTHRREDFPPEMASYINRYHRGRLVVDWRGEFLKLKSWQPTLGNLGAILPGEYF